MEKASFDLLNKLFVITFDKKNHQTLLTAWNFLTVIRESQPYVLPIIPRRLLKVIVLGEHHVLKDLFFYEEAHEADARAHQEHLDQREEKRQKGKLRKGRSEKRHILSFAVRHPIKKKKSSTKVVKVLAPVFESFSASTFFVPLSTNSSVPNSEGDLDPPRFERSDLDPQSSEFEPVILVVIYKPEVEEDTTTKLRVVFQGETTQTVI